MSEIATTAAGGFAFLVVFIIIGMALLDRS